MNENNLFYYIWILLRSRTSSQLHVNAVPGAVEQDQ